jgi:hypothetical protein
LIEESRENKLLHSRDMTQAAWSKTDVTAARTQVGLDGTANSACLMTEGSAGAAELRQVSSITTGASACFSIVCKRGNTDWVSIAITETIPAAPWTNVAYVNCNLATGALGATSTVGAATGVSASVANLGGGFYRVMLIGLMSGTVTQVRCQINSASASTGTTRVSGATYIVDCAQLEVGAFATSIIVTDASTKTRAADRASMVGTAFSSWFSNTAGTFVCEFDTQLSAGLAKLAYRFGDGTSVGQVGPYVSSSNQVIVDKGGLGTLFIQSAAYAGGVAKHALAYSAAGIAGSYLGGTVGSSVTTPLASNTTLNFGNEPAVGNVLNGHIRRLAYYPTRLPNASLVALSA